MPGGSPPAPAPDRLIDLILGYRQAKVLMVAAQLGLFDSLERPRRAPAVARRLKTEPRATEILLDALAAMGLLRKELGRYRHSPLSRRYLVSGRPGYFGDNLRFQEAIWEAWSDLSRVLKGGEARPLEAWLGDRGFTRDYIRGMENIAKRPAAEIAEAVEAGRARRLLDVGAGPGTYSLAFLGKNPLLGADLLDLPGTLEITREALSRRPALARRARLLPADYRKAGFGRESYDLILMSHITHDEGPQTNRELLRKSREALRPGGQVVIHDFTVSPDRTAPLFGALFSVHMLVYTRGGRAYTSGEYKAWLAEAGFSDLWEREISAGSRNPTRIIVGRAVRDARDENLSV